MPRPRRWLSARYRIALPATATRRADTSYLGGYDQVRKHVFAAYSIGPRAAAELVAHLRDRHAKRVGIGEVIVGRGPAKLPLSARSFEWLLRAVQLDLWGVDSTSAVAIVLRDNEAVILAVGGYGAMEAVAAWAEQLRVPTAEELDDPQRELATGDPIKCTDRVVR